MGTPSDKKQEENMLIEELEKINDSLNERRKPMKKVKIALVVIIALAVIIAIYPKWNEIFIIALMGDFK